MRMGPGRRKAAIDCGMRIANCGLFDVVVEPQELATGD